MLRFWLRILKQHGDKLLGCQSLSEINKWLVLVYLGLSAGCARLVIVLDDPMVVRPCIIPLDKVQCLV